MLTAPILALALAAPPDLLTTAEKTGFARTGRHAEAQALCAAYARAFPRRARCLTFGETPEGRPMVALAASADGVLDPAAARARRRPVVLFQGAIHAGEQDGKDAGFIALRRHLASKDGGPLGRVTALFVPILNVDGHERFGPGQRPNQRGPEEGGWRTTARNLNLNRDYTKADAPETRALLALLAGWDPVVYADLHVTDGAKFEHDVAVMVEPRHGFDPGLRPAGAALSDALLERLGATGHLPLDFYPSFADERDPASGFERGVAPPRFSQSYWAARNRLGVLYEAHSWRPYRHRVRACADFLDALLDLAAVRGSAWREAEDRADREGPSLAGREVVLDWQRGDQVGRIAFRGYAYERPISAITGTPVPRYDESRPLLLDLPIAEEPRPRVKARLPAGGWIVPASHAALLEDRLRLHGIRFERLPATRPQVAVEAWRAETVEFGAEPADGRQRLTATGRWLPAAREVRKGSLWVPAAQARALLAAHLLEPEGPDSFLAWGEFNAHFVRVEWIEPYLLEDFARDLMARDPAVRAAFEAAFPPGSATPAGAPAREEPDHGKDPRLEWFARRHPAWDAAWRLYPVLRAAARP
jgi:hypothetical protein